MLPGPNLPLLERLAQLTGGRSFAATDADALAEVFRTIDALEKSPVRGQILTRYNEHYRPLGRTGPGLASSSTGCFPWDGYGGCLDIITSLL